MSERDAKIRGALIGPKGGSAFARGRESVESISHLDGCHFYCWLVRDNGDYSVTFDEREGTDLALHRRDPSEGEKPCARCNALRRGAEPRHLKVALPDYPKEADAREGFLHTLAAVGVIDETEANIDRVTLVDLERSDDPPKR